MGAVDGTGTLRRIGGVTVNGSGSPALAVPESTVLVVPDAGDDTWAKLAFEFSPQSTGMVVTWAHSSGVLAMVRMSWRSRSLR